MQKAYNYTTLQIALTRKDVGGSWGYEEYIRIMADDKDPEYENMKAWAESQKERKISKEKINDQLSNSINGFGYSWW